MTHRKLFLTVFSLLMSISIAVAQQDTCPDLVADALAATDSACTGISRNQACYGNISINAELADDELTFDQQGDTVDLTDIERMTLSPYIEADSSWGVALLSVQANIPDTVPGQNVTFLLFGDVDIANAGDAMEAFYFSSGVGTAGCKEAQNGILITTPQGVGTIELVANNVSIELGSTAFLTAEPAEMMTVALLGGNATVTADGESQSFEGGFFVEIPIDEDLEPIGPPTEPEELVEEMIVDLPDVMVFIPEDDSEDDSGSNGGTGDIVGVDIVPLSGTWSFAVDSVVGSDGCPPMMASAIESQPIPPTTIEFADAFDLGAFMSSVDDAGLPGNVEYANPSPGVFTMSFAMEGASFTWTMTIVSETQMYGAYTMDMSAAGMNCILDVNYSVTHQG